MIKTKPSPAPFLDDIFASTESQPVAASHSAPLEVLQLIKAQEFERFFRRYLPDYHPHLNHLEEIAWMTAEEAESQHEFFDYQENFWQRLKRKLHPLKDPDLEKLPPREREWHLQFRKYLEVKYLGRPEPETARLLPDHWQYPLSPEEIEQIPVSLAIYQSMFDISKIHWAFLLIVLAVTLFGGVLAMNSGGTPTGEILIRSNVSGAAIYLNGEKKGYADISGKLEKLPPGRYRVELRKRGYTASPVEVELGSGTAAMAEVTIQMAPVVSKNFGFLKINTDFSDSKVFVNDEFVGTLEAFPVLQLEKGDHLISVEKDGYQTQPAKQWIRVTAGDTSEVRFRQVPGYPAAAPSARFQPSAPAIGQGLISITANVTGARIFLNGKDTGKESDYVFTGLPEGEYEIALRKEGYRTKPASRVVRLGPNDSRVDLNFQLIKESARARIQTDPPSAKIFVDGAYVGKGFFEGELNLGTHEISFEEISGYKTPSPRTMHINSQAPVELFVKYFPQMNLGATVSATGNINATQCDLITGYTLNNRGFAASSEGGPEVVFHEQLKQYVWKFGFAFPYRTPRGNDAIKLIFRLPLDYRNDQHFSLEISGVASEERYPRSHSKTSALRVKINHHVENFSAPFRAEAGNGLKTFRWDISPYLTPGLNTIEFSTTEHNTTYFFVKSIRISN